MRARDAWRWLSAQRAALRGPVALVALIAAIVLLPVVTVIVLAARASDAVLPHLIRQVLPRAFFETLLLLTGVGVMTVLIGAGTAWLITMFRFPGRSILDRLLILPLAMPTYITAYAYVELLEFTGPLQRTLQALFGWRTPADSWLPEVRGLGGAIWVIGLVLYPYVYLSARASFVQQSVCVLEVARTLGRTPLGTLFSVALPLARPALAAGLALVLMECLNDFGAVQYLGVETLTVAVYATWLQRGSLGGAAQIATIVLVLAIALFMAERAQRGGGTVQHTTGRYRAIPFSDLTGGQGVLACAVCLLPVIAGFALPFLVLVANASQHYGATLAAGFWRAAFNSVVLAAVAAALSVGLGLVLVYAARTYRSWFTTSVLRLVGVGYAIPGIILALGLVIPLAGFDAIFDGWLRQTIGISSGLLISGSVAILVLAYVCRFLAVAVGSIEAGYGRLSPNLDAAARTLGETASSALVRVHLPMLAPALAAAALLVFVDGMKELPATLLLRPMNFETLATKVYAFAAQEQFEQGALGALAIVLVGLVPVLLLHKAVAGGRVGS
jgi:iron(III) transport system permease protein